MNNKSCQYLPRAEIADQTQFRVKWVCVCVGGGIYGMCPL